MTAAYLDLTALNSALKELYTDQVVHNLVYKQNPFLSMVKKNTDFGGKNKPIPVISGSPLGSNTFANAQANATYLNVDAFALTLTRDYVVAYIDNLTMLSAKTDKMSFINSAKGTIDGAIRTASNRLASSMFRAGTGMIGVITSISGSGVIVLTDPTTVTQFERGMVLNTYDDAVGTNQSTSNAKGYVVAVNRSAGTVTVSTTATGSGGLPSNWSTSFPYICVDGDLNAKLKGLAAWIPSTAPTSTTFFGVNRAVDSTRLGGVRYDGSAQPIEEALIDGSALIAREGGSPTIALVSYASFGALEKSLGAKVQYIDCPTDVGVAFSGIKVHGANSEIKIIPDRNCPGSTAYLLDMDTWALESACDAPMILNQIDGLDMLRVYNADAAEIRIGSYAQLACNAPGWNGVISLGA